MAAQLGSIPNAAVRDTPPDPDDYGLVVRVIGGIVVIGPVIVTQTQPAASTVSTVAVAAVPVLVMAANASRLGAMIFNDSNARLYLKLGLGASTANFTVRLDAQSYFELPFPVYTGDITAVRAAGPASSVQATELT